MIHYCTICGVVIGRGSAAPGTAPTDLEWYQQLRVVQSHHENASDPRPATTVSGVGYVDFLDRIIAPSNYSSFFEDGGANLAIYVPFYDPQYGTWTFPFHASCWEILFQRVPEAHSDTFKFASLFFQTLFCTTWGRYRYIRPGHDFEGAIKFQKPVGVPIQAMIDQGYEYLLCRPSQFQDVREILSSHSNQPSIFSHRPAQKTCMRSSIRDVFSALPLEILLLIISILPSADIQQLRLASRHVASVTNPASLPQSFWRSRFHVDFELGFAFPQRILINQNWRDAYALLAHALNDSSSSISARAKSRRRIWRLVGLNAALLARHMTIDTLHGNHYPESTDKPHTDDTLTHSQHQGQIISAQLFEDCQNLLRSGSRRLETRAVRLPLKNSVLKRIRVYTDIFNSQRFISGLEFQIISRSTEETTTIALGYISATTDDVIEIAPFTNMSGLELAVCALGVTGLRIAVDKEKTRWVGDRGNEEATVAFGKLSFEIQDAEQIQLVADFDAFKIVALGVMDGSDISSATSPQLRPQVTWTPSYPRAAVSFTPHVQAYHNGFRPVLNLDFGGSHGEQLPKLTRIVTHVLNSRAPIVGLTFHLDNNSPVHFGRQGLMEISSFIDGPGGEYISSIVIERSTAESRILLLQMNTNHENHIVVGRNELQSSGLSENRPSLIQDIASPNPFVEAEGKTVQMLQPPTGQQITGFTATIGGDGCFESFGLQSESVQPRSERIVRDPSSAILNSASAHLASSLGSYFIGERSNGCRAYTSAAMQSVKHIRFSSGMTGSSRHFGEVSGLWLDYYESRPSIVGQWFFESACMNLENDERITGITIWVTNTRKSFSEKCHMGRVVRVLISSSLQSVSYPDETALQPHEYTVLRFQDNYLEHLSSLVWVYNDVHDFTRVTRSLTSSCHNLFHWNPYQFLETRPWADPQRALWAGKTKLDRLVSVHAYHGRVSRCAVTGFSFQYTSGVARNIGDVSGAQTPRSLRLSATDTIAGVSIYKDLHGVREIVFHSRTADEGEQTQHPVVGMDSETLALPGSFDHHYIDLLHHRYKSHYFMAGAAADSEENLPEGEVVGLWGVTMADDNFVLGFSILC
ncbi:hypothetical protein BJX70DRAFT_374603 [Aspergillus crustosus]